MKASWSYSVIAALVLAATGCNETAGGGAGDGGHGGAHHAIKTVFIVVMENANWSQIKGSSSAPYLNDTLLKAASHAEAYSNPPGNHPSLPNYLWLEAGSNLGVTGDGEPAKYHQATTAHLVTQLEAAGHTWKAYVENIDGKSCPLSDSGLFVARHVPMLFFDDVTANNSATAARCLSHIRPFGELASDLQSGKVADYNFITPNLCDDGHGTNPLAGDFTCVPLVTDLVKSGDDWLKANVPAILGSSVYTKGGALFITWDEGEGSLSDGPIGMLALSPFARGAGYSNTKPYTHSSMLRTIQEVFSLTPMLGDAAQATDLSDLFTTFP
jgi:phosphatidylinositol-3-phosphatase